MRVPWLKEKRELPFGNFSVWPYRELVKKERQFGVHDMRGEEIRAEIERRRAERNGWYAFISVMAAIVSAAAAIFSLWAAHGK